MTPPTNSASAATSSEETRQRNHDHAAREIEERERRRFKPFIWVHTVDGAHSFLTAMGEKHVKVLWMNEGFGNLSESHKLKTVQSTIQDHYQKTGGRYIGFGAILRYQYADTFDTSLVLDTNGVVIEKNGGTFLLPEVWMELR